jgi:hypothetical protein
MRLTRHRWRLFTQAAVLGAPPTAGGGAAVDAPNISYAGSPFTENIGVAMSGGTVTNSGGASTNFAVLSGSLPNGITLNATTGELTGTPV